MRPDPYRKNHTHVSPAEQLAAQLRARRAVLNKKQSDIASLAKVGQPTISRLEDDPSGASVGTLTKVAGALGLSLTLTEAA